MSCWTALLRAQHAATLHVLLYHVGLFMQGCGIVVFTHIASALAAMEALHNKYHWTGGETTMVVEWADPSRHRRENPNTKGPPFTLCVYGLSATCNHHVLQDVLMIHMHAAPLIGSVLTYLIAPMPCKLQAVIHVAACASSAYHLPLSCLQVFSRPSTRRWPWPAPKAATARRCAVLSHLACSRLVWLRAHHTWLLLPQAAGVPLWLTGVLLPCCPRWQAQSCPQRLGGRGVSWQSMGRLHRTLTRARLQLRLRRRRTAWLCQRHGWIWLAALLLEV
jgi:hypothetical protein